MTTDTTIVSSDHARSKPLIGAHLNSKQSYFIGITCLVLLLILIGLLSYISQIVPTSNTIRPLKSISTSSLSKQIPVETNTIDQNENKLQVNLRSHSSSSSNPKTSQTKNELRVNGSNVQLSNGTVNKTFVSSDGNSNVHVSVESSSTSQAGGDGM